MPVQMSISPGDLLQVRARYGSEEHYYRAGDDDAATTAELGNACRDSQDVGHYLASDGIDGGSRQHGGCSASLSEAMTWGKRKVPASHPGKHSDRSDIILDSNFLLFLE